MAPDKEEGLQKQFNAVKKIKPLEALLAAMEEHYEEGSVNKAKRALPLSEYKLFVAKDIATLMDKATMPPGSSGQTGPISLGRPVGFSDTEDPLVSFFVREAPPLLVWPRGLAPRVHCYLYFEDGEGLSLLWYSDLQEMERGEDGKPELEDEDDLFKTPISSLCEEVVYCYYGEEGADSDDFKEWEKESELEENAESGKFRLPAFVQLVFRQPKEDLERTVTIPVERISPNGLSPDKR